MESGHLLRNLFSNIRRKSYPNPLIEPSAFAEKTMRSPKYHLASGGENNPDKIFYVIQRTPGAGFFANFTFVIHHLKIADHFGMIPVVDFQNFTTLYNETAPVQKLLNAWEYYFDQVSPYTLEEVYTSKHIFICDGVWYLSCMPRYITEDPNLPSVYRKYIRIKPSIRAMIDDFAHRHFRDEAVLGVHFRGQEMKRAPNHPFPPTKKQICSTIDRLLETGAFSKIFVSTESRQYLQFLKHRYGSILFYDSYRSDKNSYLESHRPQHRYLLGRDILVESVLLSKTDALVCGGSMVSEMAAFLAGPKKQPYQYRIDNGKNVSIPFIARYLWYVKAAIPSDLGGFGKIGHIR